MKAEHFDCVCYSDEHCVRFLYDEIDNELYLSVFLLSPGILQRLWIAVKYVLGYKCRYGHWDVWVLRAEDAQRLSSLLNQVIQGAKE